MLDDIRNCRRTELDAQEAGLTTERAAALFAIVSRSEPLSCDGHRSTNEDCHDIGQPPSLRRRRGRLRLHSQTVSR
jgi:hypothetical protein